MAGHPDGKTRRVEVDLELAGSGVGLRVESLLRKSDDAGRGGRRKEEERRTREEGVE